MLVPVPSFDDVPDAAASDTAASDAAAPDAAASDAAPSPETRALAQRHDGITPERQRIFVEVLAATGSVSQAARQAGASRQAFYAHRNRDAGRDFLEAWDHAQARSTQLLCDAAYERAIYGVEEPVFYHGEQIGTRRRYNDKLLATLLRVRAPDDYAPPGDRRGLFRVSLTPPASFDDMIAELGLPEPEPEPPRRRRRLRGPA